jgi:hypothetical protein
MNFRDVELPLNGAAPVGNGWLDTQKRKPTLMVGL